MLAKMMDEIYKDMLELGSCLLVVLFDLIMAFTFPIWVILHKIIKSYNKKHNKNHNKN